MLFLLPIYLTSLTSCYNTMMTGQHNNTTTLITKL